MNFCEPKIKKETLIQNQSIVEDFSKRFMISKQVRNGLQHRKPEVVGSNPTGSAILRWTRSLVWIRTSACGAGVRVVI
ncbi:hypothetical protein CW706_01315 [Candidatus Bathyarchaeota archaeon]|nr:MAG: hypothetical protein CW706_01315 [Candidatus Bathyarchaeota archaeon]